MHSDVLKVTYTHNQPVVSAHAISFWHVSEEIKQAFHYFFGMGHSASSTVQAHQQSLYIQAEYEAAARNSLADHAWNPLIQDIYWLFTKWREAKYGKDDMYEHQEKWVKV